MRINRKAFTLIELIIVIIIIGILASIAAPMMQGMTIKAKLTEMLTVVSTIAAAEQAYYVEYGTFATWDDGVPGHENLYWTIPTDPTNIFANAFRNILGVEIYQNNKSDFSYICWTPSDGSIYVMRFSTGKGLCAYSCARKKFLSYGDDEWRNYLNLSY